jgi:hypothetical protein
MKGLLAGISASVDVPNYSGRIVSLGTKPDKNIPRFVAKLNPERERWVLSIICCRVGSRRAAATWINAPALRGLGIDLLRSLGELLASGSKVGFQSEDVNRNLPHRPYPKHNTKKISSSAAKTY